jgi:GrpB-like predicted nucleotidyltransferase (UPF0157 family)
MTTADVDEPISIVEPDPTWPRLFVAEAERLRPVLSGVVTRIEHVGSTAVPGLGGKPIVDLLVGVRTLAEGRTAAALLAGQGYEDFGESSSRAGSTCVAGDGPTSTSPSRKRTGRSSARNSPSAITCVPIRRRPRLTPMRSDELMPREHGCSRPTRSRSTRS